MDKQLRKARSTLAISGLAVMAFSTWAVLKVVLVFLMNTKRIEEMIERGGEALPSPLLFYSALFVILAVFLGLHAYVGACALREGRGDHGGRLYVCMAAVMAVALTLGVAGQLAFYLGIAPEAGSDTGLVTILLDAGSCFACIKLVASAMSSRRLATMLGGGEGGGKQLER